MPLPPPSRAATSKTTSPPSPTAALRRGHPARALVTPLPRRLRGPLCAVRDGDWVHYDIEKRELTIELSDEELQRRMAEAELRLEPKTGWLSIYQRCVGSILKGATLIEDHRA